MADEGASRRMVPLRHPSEIPPDMSEKEAREFWDTHEITEEYLEKAGPPPEDLLPPASSGARRPRTRSISLRSDEDPEGPFSGEA